MCVTVPKNTPNNFNGQQFCCLETVTMTVRNCRNTHRIVFTVFIRKKNDVSKHNFTIAKNKASQSNRQYVIIIFNSNDFAYTIHVISSLSRNL